MRFAQQLVLPVGVLAGALTTAAPAMAFDPAALERLRAEGDCIYCDLSQLAQPGLALPEANLSGSNLSRSDLSGADLTEALLAASDFSDSKLGGALLAGARLDRALLSGADLSNADLQGASLRHADLRDANLAGAALAEADLFGADLRGTDLSGTDLSKADLRWAKVQDLLAPGAPAKLAGAVAPGADLRFVKGLTPEMAAQLCGDPETRHSLEGAVLWFCEPLTGKAPPDAAPIAASVPADGEESIAAPAPEEGANKIAPEAPAADEPAGGGAGEIEMSNVEPDKSAPATGDPADSSAADAEAYPGGKMDAVEVVPVEQLPLPAGGGDAAVAEEVKRQAAAEAGAQEPQREPSDAVDVTKQ